MILVAVRNHRCNDKRTLQITIMIWITYKKCIIGYQNKIKPNFNIKYYRELLSDRKHECN